MLRLFNTSLLLTCLSVSAYAQDDIELPVTPADLMGRSSMPQEVQFNPLATVKDKSPVTFESPSLSPYVAPQVPAKKYIKPKPLIPLKAGQSDKAPIALDVMNRIQTPFKNVEVKTATQGVEITTEGSDIYVLTLTETPIGLFIRQEGVPETTVGLTLLPQANILQQQIKLDVEYGDDVKELVYDAEREIDRRLQQHDTNNPMLLETNEYEKSLKYLLRALALNEIPRGFSLERPEIFELSEYASQSTTPCTQNVLQSVEQRMVSGKQIIDIVLIQNPLDEIQEVRAELCYKPDVMAVGLYPKSQLKPGEKTEMYIIRKKEDVRKKRSKRKSLL